jgi:hypothetical protein
MNRRDLLKLFGATPLAPMLPMVKGIEVARVASEDVIVLKAAVPISQETAGRLKAHLDQVFPGVKAIVLDSDLDMKIVRKE